MPIKLLCLAIISGTAVALARGMHGFAEPGESFALLLVLTTLLAVLMHGGFLVVLIAPFLLARRFVRWANAIWLMPVSVAAVAGVAEGFNKWRATPWLLICSALLVGLYGFAWTRLFACRRLTASGLPAVR